jgi:hypothetical protein
MGAAFDSILADFDRLSELAKHDPEGFEAYRQHLIDDMINQSPTESQLNLRRFQWRIDQETRHHHSSLGRCVKLSSLMTHSLEKLRQQIEILGTMTTGKQKKTIFSQRENVVEFDLVRSQY